MKSTRLIALLLTTLVVAGCAGDPNRRAKIGAITGAVVGGYIGSEVGDESDTNVAIGAALGALAGGAAGHYMDNQHAELQKRLAAEQARHNLYITEMPGNALRIGIASDYSFAVDSAELTLGAKATFAKIANVLKDYDSTAVHVVGFTDSSGAAEYNMKLSQRRAEAVASFLGSEGVPYARMRTWGRGETQPIASNQTKAGRSRNRRVEIVIKPIIKGQAGDAFTAPQNLGA